MKKNILRIIAVAIVTLTLGSCAMQRGRHNGHDNRGGGDNHGNHDNRHGQ